MAYETPKMSATKRDRTGSRYAQRLRREGLLPAVLYGHGEGVAHIALDGHDLSHHLHHGAHVLELKLDGGTETALIKDVQYDALGDTVIHVDLARVNLTEEVTVSVPLTIKGQDNCEALKEEGAIIEQPLVDLEVQCLVNNIPEEILIDISDLPVEQNVHVGDLKMPEGVATEHEPDDVVCFITIMEEIEEEEEAEAEAASAEPEVISERREEEEGAEGDEAKAEQKKDED